MAESLYTVLALFVYDCKPNIWPDSTRLLFRLETVQPEYEIYCRHAYLYVADNPRANKAFSERAVADQEYTVLRD